MFNIVLIYCMFNIVLRSKDVTYMFTINDGITHNVKHVEHQKQLGRVLLEDGYQCLVQLGA